MRKLKKVDKKQLKREFDEQNLGLDADHSSDEPSLMTRLDDDNDRISGNPDGEHDEGVEGSLLIYSSLEDK